MREYVTLYKIHETHDHVKYKLPVEYREEIVRCGDCKHYYEYQDLCERLKPGMVVDPDGFCAWGERREP